MTDLAAKFEDTARRLCVAVRATPKDIRVLNGRTFNATFTGEAAANRAARALGLALSHVRVAPGFDQLVEPVARCTTTRRDTKVWRVHGFVRGTVS